MVKIEVLTPERVAYQGEAILVVVSTESGLLGIGRGHIPLVAPLVPGEVEIKHSKAASEYLVVASGFVEVLPDTVRIMAHQAELASELQEEKIKEAMRAAEKARADASTSAEVASTTAVLAHTIAQLKVARRHHSRSRTHDQDANP